MFVTPQAKMYHSSNHPDLSPLELGILAEVQKNSSTDQLKIISA